MSGLVSLPVEHAATPGGQEWTDSGGQRGHRSSKFKSTLCKSLQSIFASLLILRLALSTGCHVQQGKELALQRKRLKLFISPFRTLYYFAGCTSAAAGRGLLWLLKHRVTLFFLIPTLISYVGFKVTGNSPAKACTDSQTLLAFSEEAVRIILPDRKSRTLHTVMV